MVINFKGYICAMNTAFEPNENLPKGGKNTYFRQFYSESSRQAEISDCLCQEDFLMTFLLLVKGPRSFKEIQLSWTGDPRELFNQMLHMIDIGLIFMEKHGGVAYYFVHGDNLHHWVELMVHKITGEPFEKNQRWFHQMDIREDQIGMN